MGLCEIVYSNLRILLVFLNCTLLKGAYVGVRRDAHTNIISGRIYLERIQNKKEAQIIPESIPIRKGTIISSEVVFPRNFLLGHEDLSTSDIGLYHINRVLFSELEGYNRNNDTAISGKFICGIYSEEHHLNQGNTGYYVDLYPIIIENGIVRLIINNNQSKKGTVEFKNSILKITIIDENGVDSVFFKVTGDSIGDLPISGVCIGVSNQKLLAKAAFLIKDLGEKNKNQNFKDFKYYLKLNIENPQAVLKENLRFNGAISYLRGSIDRFIDLSQSIDFFHPRDEHIRRQHFYSACYLATLENNEPKIITDELRRAYIHGFAIDLAYLKLMLKTSDGKKYKSINSIQNSINDDFKLLKGEVSDGGALVEYKDYILQQWGRALNPELYQICENKNSSLVNKDGNEDVFISLPLTYLNSSLFYKKQRKISLALRDFFSKNHYTSYCACYDCKNLSEFQGLQNEDLHEETLKKLKSAKVFVSIIPKRQKDTDTIKKISSCITELSMAIALDKSIILFIHKDEEFLLPANLIIKRTNIKKFDITRLESEDIKNELIQKLTENTHQESLKRIGLHLGRMN